MKYYLLKFFVFFSLVSFAQETSYEISYQRSFNGKIIENQDLLKVFATHNQVVLSTEKIEANQATLPFEKTLIDTENLSFYQVATLSSNKVISYKDNEAIKNQKLEFLPETKKILGYLCKKAKTVINSNAIEIWYTNELNLKASPTVLGINLGLVLEITRNGNSTTQAIKIQKRKSKNTSNTKIDNTVDVLTYKDLLWKSRFTTIPVFKDEIINFSSEAKSNDSIIRFANGTIILKKIKVPNQTKSNLAFLDVIEQSNGDAYDRTGSVFIIPISNSKQTFLSGLEKGKEALPIYENGNGKKYQGVVATSTYEPLTELMRFFTPFGIKQYNHIELKDKTWENQVSYRQEITDVFQQFAGREVWIGTFIGNYDKGGHKITMNITLHSEDVTFKPTKLFPLFNTTNIMEMAGQDYGTMFDVEKGLETKINLSQPLKNAKIRYITTGHGGWENGDEFVPKKNTILVNGKEVFQFTPWRQDCGSYRLYNPASGNFPNGLSSSDYSRANWCPGMVTTPTYIDLGDLPAGEYTIQVKIPQGKPEGESFSAWNVSGILIGE
ncbi:PNGase F N-terminal domain-containing protein [Flavobacterium terrigena]|uniref:GLPGLI family protein n=1 Tax=Flavobacterium terrigena TaxID=402734 RepID=A0A1H6RWY6_9FLAO|nr:PNGase F N-terminal domain-containing protein [Flavobacterium terrigena]SEI58004.1 GLPGLI family protein [Flavobacterium terrigena]